MHATEAPTPATRPALARNVRLLRTAHGISTRELARLAGLSQKTIVTVEGGRHGSPSTVRKLASALGTVPSRLLGEVEPPSDLARFVPAAEGRWFFADEDDARRYRQSQRRAGLDPRTEPEAGPDAIQDAGERFRLGSVGRALAFVQVKGGAIGSARHMVCVTEIHASLTQDPDPGGGTYLFHVLRGAVELELGDERRTLASGDAMVFASRLPLRVRPFVEPRVAEDVPWVLAACLRTLG